MKKVVLIVEDDADQLEMLRQLVWRTNENTEIYTADNAMQAYKIFMEKTIDVLLADIILDTSRPGDVSGIHLVESFRKVPKYMFTPVIFVTSLEDPTMYAYTDLNCIGYIEKPFDPKQIMRLVERALNNTTMREKEVSLSFRKDGIWYPIRVEEIVYMESIKHIMHIHLKNGSVPEFPYVTCKQIMEESDVGPLVQCNRSTIVNKDYVESIDIQNKYIVFKDNLGRVDIGVTYKKKIATEFGNGS